ncbi:MAG TPA: hypothetical protein VMT61_10530 [Candidatus Binataceae bacterium]|nr:hypothetical protein [Candidatus Binataceae bacterium]
MPRRALGLVALAALFLTGCGQQQPKAHITALHPDLVLVARVKSDEIQPRPAGCSLQIFDRIPAGVVRDLGSIDLAGSVPAGTDIFVAVNQKACESGADGLVVSQREQRNLADRTEYHIIAEAILIHPEEDTNATVQPASTEALMQPMSNEENSGEPAHNELKSAMTESSIAATEAVPLKAMKSPLGEPSASPQPSSMPVASVEATPLAAVGTATSPSMTAMPMESSAPTATATATAVATITLTPTVTTTSTATPSPVIAPTITSTATATETPTIVVTATSTATPIVADTPSATATPTETPTAVVTATVTPTATVKPPTTTATPSPSQPSSSAASISPSPSPASPQGSASPDSTGD